MMKRPCKSRDSAWLAMQTTVRDRRPYLIFILSLPRLAGVRYVSIPRWITQSAGPSDCGTTTENTPPGGGRATSVRRTT